MVHGHAHARDWRSTQNYVPCGDMREINEVAALMKLDGKGVINLRNHGFLMFASTIEEMESLAYQVSFENRL
jgi:hypothetical protein